MGGHAPGGLVLVERVHGIGGAPDLEGAHLLEVLALEQYARTQPVVQTRAGEYGCAMNMRPDASGRFADVGKYGCGHG
jgi:hypothetical protein